MWNMLVHVEHVEHVEYAIDMGHLKLVKPALHAEVIPCSLKKADWMIKYRRVYNQDENCLVGLLIDGTVGLLIDAKLSLLSFF